MSGHKLVPVEPTAEMVEAAQDAYMPFGDMDIAIRMAVLAAPAVQHEAFEALASQLLTKRAEILGRPLKWAEAIEITAIVTSMPDEEKQRLLDMDDAPAVHGEPVAYLFPDDAGRTKIVLGKETAEHWCPPDESITPLYTTPQPAPDVAELQAELERERKRRFDGNEQASREHREDVEVLVDALELAQGFLRNKGYPEEDPLLLGAINAALTAHRQGNGAC